MAQNEMKAMCALPVEVRSMEGLGVSRIEGSKRVLDFLLLDSKLDVERSGVRSINEHRLRRRAAKFHACLDHDMLHCCERCWTTPRVMNMVWRTPYQLGVWFGRF